jgi:Tfp pilus assembly major pilin PilA
MRNSGKQRGITILGFMFVAAVLIIAAVVGFRVVPSYIEYFAVKKALEQALYETKDYNSPNEVRNSFKRRADTGYIESVTAQDVIVVKDGNAITATATWNRKLPLVANVSLFIEFEAVASR